MDINSQHHNLPWKPNFAQIGGFFLFWRPFWIQNGRQSKPTMNINSQHHNLLGNQIFKSPLFVSMATAAKFVQPIPICLAYLVQLDVDVVPIKFRQFLFCE
jgi:hypothetical protein